MRICVIGTGYVGLVVGACLAEMGNTVACGDVDEEKISLLQNGHSPIFEPGLEPLITRNQADGRLSFSTDIGSAIRTSRVIFIAVGTPSMADGSSDLSAIYAVAEAIGENMNDEKIVITKSTVPVGTTHHLRGLIAARTSTPFHVCSNPEFLKEGRAVDDFMHPDRIVIGTETDHAREVLAELYEPFVRTGKPVLFMDILSSEITKYAANAMLAVRISFMNQMAALCDEVGADVREVRGGMASDPRIGPEFLFAGTGYGGSCLPKDVRAIVKSGADHGLDLSLPRAANEWNESWKETVTTRLFAELGDDLSDRRLAVWGLAFKAGTDDVREAPSLTVLPRLLTAGARIRAHDPEALETAREQLPPAIELFDDQYDVCDGADALLILTEWSQYRRPDFPRLKELLTRPLIVDGRNLYERKQMQREGFTYLCIGRPPVR